MLRIGTRKLHYILTDKLKQEGIKLGREGVKYWINSGMRSRWMAISLLQIEKRMERVNNFEKLSLLRKALKTELRIKRQRAA